MELHKAMASTRLSPVDTALTTASEILAVIMKYRRFADAAAHAECSLRPCSKCTSPHLTKIASAVMSRERLVLVLPAFPGKSPNPAKVLGTLPDMAEQQSLEFLNDLCSQIQQIYSPGAELILCSDGRVFSDAVGLRDEDISAYQDVIVNMIEDLSLDSISTFGADEFYQGVSFDEMRAKLLQQYGDSIETIQETVRRGKDETAHSDDRELHRLYCGLTRFLVEDAMHPGQTKSRTAVQKECRIRAYEVIRKSNAWSRLIEEKFPHAIRLSIHPQGCGSRKLGLQLIDANNWMTPWHGVAVRTQNGYVLRKRAEVEALGAKLIHDLRGQPSHYELMEA